MIGLRHFIERGTGAVYSYPAESETAKDFATRESFVETKVVPLGAVVIERPLPEFVSRNFTKNRWEILDEDANRYYVLGPTTDPEFYEKQALANLAVARHLRENSPEAEAQIRAIRKVLAPVTLLLSRDEALALYKRGVRVVEDEK